MNPELARKEAELSRLREELAELRGLVNQHLELSEAQDQVSQEREREAFARGQAAPAADYQAGYMLGHDHGLSSRQDARGFVQGIRHGYEDGMEARKEIARDLWAKQTPAKDGGLLHIVPIDRDEQREAG